ncbi:MAG: polyketide cyclase, partial [Flavobacteriaceae bacterium]|nr:polyketide cyclase [Flavobacteriaceae bacterium]
ELNWRMEARDGSMGFDYTGTYEEIIPLEYISYKIADGRRVTISFQSEGNETRVIETFETDNTHPEDQQRVGWQAILDNFKKYAELASGKTN